MIRTLAMLTLNERSTGENIKNKVLEILEEFGTNFDNLYSVTVDNGSNVLKAIRDMEDEINDDSLDNDSDNYDGNNFKFDSNCSYE